ncbi:acyl carrier protein [Campylobacter porcelli]|uniref:Acyl carrier protein n=1 Tax=Campylobacter porcelli TaxID=1660073 RepID=A0A1X9SXZ2_9BACT|nr:hypothetical protein [Campylobacter sp. RM6137]ARR01154.1 acyl carrier protein [Campylobacter sp. RM6137]
MDNKIIEIISTIAKINRDQLIEKIDIEKLWESIVHVEIIIALEEEFDIVFTQEEIGDTTTVRKIIDLIKTKAQ